jgi:hypothetical protein
LVDGIWSAVGMTAAQSGDLHTGAWCFMGGD